MLDIGFGELILLAVIALIALGPKQLPEVARVAGKFINDMRRVASEFTGGFTGGVAGGLIDVDAIIKPKEPELRRAEEAVARGSLPTPAPTDIESSEEEHDRKNQMSFALQPETHPDHRRDTKGESRG